MGHPNVDKNAERALHSNTRFHRRGGPSRIAVIARRPGVAGATTRSRGRCEDDGNASSSRPALGAANILTTCNALTGAAAIQKMFATEDEAKEWLTG